MIAPEFTIEVNDQRLTLHLAALPTALKTALRGRIAALSQTLLAQVRAAEPHRTGRLRSQTHAFIRERANSIRGGVTIDGTNAAPHNVAAAALEYGVHRTVRVRTHRARLTQVFGHAVAPQVVSITAHPRRVNLAERRFLRGPAGAIRQRAIADIQQAVTEAIATSERS